MKQAKSGKGPLIFSDDYKMKKCTCPIHKGSLVPVENFWTFKNGPRIGLLASRCIDGERISKGRDPLRSGFVLYSRVKFIFEELEFRLGRAEAARRIGVSSSFWWRHTSHGGKLPLPYIRKQAVVNAISVLRYCREQGEARHRDSIRHGAAARGHKEKLPIYEHEFNGKNAHAGERSRKRRRLARDLTNTQ